MHFSLATVGRKLEKHDGVGPGFDYLRLGLALLIFNAHAGIIFNPYGAG